MYVLRDFCALNNGEAMKKYLKDYLDHVGMKGKYEAKKISCEVCGFSESTLIRDLISIGRDAFGKLPVVACNRCGYLYQNPKFNRKFYDDYYRVYYKNIITKQSNLDQAFINDQKKRGQLLYDALKEYLGKPGFVLDVGCATGTMLIPFIKSGWNVYGVDPDTGFVKYGKEKLGLPIETIAAEDMKLEKGRYNFIMILGSLEHVYDPNKTLKICREAQAKEGYLLIEGRGHPQRESKIYFNHNHHRYFTFNSMELMMIKHGWEPVFTTDRPICGSTRPGGIYCLSKASAIPGRKEFLALINQGRRETPEEILQKFNKLDKSKGYR